MITEEELKKYGIKNVSAILEDNFKPRLIIKQVDDKEYIYDIDELTESVVDNILEKHIKKYLC